MTKIKFSSGGVWWVANTPIGWSYGVRGKSSFEDITLIVSRTSKKIETIYELEMFVSVFSCLRWVFGQNE